MNLKTLAKHLLLFLATVLTTAYAYYEPANPLSAVEYSLSIMLILLAHELGHYFMSKKHHVSCTLPYFLPIPFGPFGTLGAVIKMKSTIPNKKALFDIGVSGPLAGLLFTIPAIIIGLMNSTVVTVADGFNGITLGDSLLFKILSKIIIGEIPQGSDILLHPIAFAGWVGLFVTALNLLPIGQLDGGHVIYALFPKYSKYIYKIGITLLLISCIFVNPGYLLFVVILFIFGLNHPEPDDPETPLDNRRKIIGFIFILIFIISFTPDPIKMPFSLLEYLKSL